ncbi:hypothetical protein N9L47_10970 [Rhodobacteraceae bacterium]|nr:hypothetical protein [Paracoccaceae bacterium]
MTSLTSKRPASMVIAEKVREENCLGHYDAETNTWSNRDYDLAAAKKHNEDM